MLQNDFSFELFKLQGHVLCCVGMACYNCCMLDIFVQLLVFEHQCIPAVFISHIASSDFVLLKWPLVVELLLAHSVTALTVLPKKQTKKTTTKNKLH